MESPNAILAPIKRELFLLLIFSAMMFFLVFNEMWSLTYVLSAFIVPTSFFNPPLAVAIWLSYLAYEPIFSFNEVFSLYKILSPGVVIGWLARQVYFLDFVKYDTASLFWLLQFLLTPLLFIVVGNNFDSFIAYLSLCMLVLVAFISFTCCHNSKRSMLVVFCGIVVASVSCLAYAALIYDGGWRLTLTPGWGGGVRIIDQVLSLGIVSLSAIIYGGKRYWLPSKFVFFILLSLLFTFVAGLLAVVARGALLGLVAFVLTYFFVKLAETFKSGGMRRIGLLKGFFILLFFPCLIFYASWFVNKTVANGLLFDKIMQAVSNPGESPRWDIWNSILSSVLQDGALFGLGLVNIESDSGYYSHSLYVSILGAGGFLGLMLFLFFLAFHCFRVLKDTNALALSATSYFVVSYAFSGTIFSKTIWAAGVLVLLVVAFSSNKLRSASY
ncbi:hypothetical protein [Halomonas koreensis]|uniref:O-antigen ligase like membrane protein n=1 Tax=Halomonas koreensis TaxID=245385 RepID=A0ABU1FZ48_9GAMM|nr:hypothetical protein [Halomonas koreensis]MDR5865946.1 hypothetical protein [Halomonas koreensis]